MGFRISLHGGHGQNVAVDLLLLFKVGCKVQGDSRVLRNSAVAVTTE